MSPSEQRIFGAKIDKGGVRFCLWAPTDKSIELVVANQRVNMPDSGDGWREVHVPGAAVNSRYAFVVDGSTEIPDPASRFQPEGVFKHSQVIDPNSFRWTDDSWRGRPWAEAVIWEAHVGTATPEGTYRALMEKLPHMRETGITAIELMPLADCPGDRNWGYDGVLPFAPKSNYGTPDDLKALIDAAHLCGIMMILDVVYNHFGPSGNFLHLYAGRFFTERHQTPWGAGINFDGKGSEFVRAFFIQNALYWLNEFHFDGLRFDAAHALLDDSETHFLKSLADAIRADAGDRHWHLILENEHNESHWLEQAADEAPQHFTAQWNDDFHHCWHVMMTGESEGYYQSFTVEPQAKLERALSEGFVYQGEAVDESGRRRGEPSAHLSPTAFIDFLQNHDQIGNRAFGERLSALANAHQLELARTVLLLSPQIPMLFMGEEWGSRTPFFFFVDFGNDQALSNAVRDGRRREFAAFKAFAGAGGTSEIPDPTALKTFKDSKIDWADLETPDHALVLAHTRDLLALRRKHVQPLIASAWMGGAVSSHAPLDIVWRFAAGVLRLRVNLTEQDHVITLAATEAFIKGSSGATVRHGELKLAPASCIFTSEVA